jgi:hypothetical protein
MRWWLSDIWCLRELQNSPDVLADADIVYDKAAVLMSTMKGTACEVNVISEFQVTGN